MRCTPFMLLTLVCCLPAADNRVYQDPTSLSDETTQSGITARVITPRVAQVVMSPVITLSLEAYTSDGAPLSVTATDVAGAVYRATSFGEPGPSQRFDVLIPLLHGPNPLRVRIGELSGFRTRTLEVNVTYGGPTPGLRWTVVAATQQGCASNAVTSVTSARRLCMTGRVTNGDANVDTVAVSAGDGQTMAVVAADGSFEAEVDLAVDTENQLSVVVFDVAGRRTSFQQTLVQDATPPDLDVPFARGEPPRTESNRIVVRGTVSDEGGVADVAIVNDTGGRREALVRADGGFEQTVQLEPGGNRFEVVAQDRAGNVQRVPLTIVRERLIRLAAAESQGATQLRLDKRGLSELLTEDAQRRLELVTISLRTPVIEALRAIREPERFGLDTSGWGPAETNMANVLRMTPDVADLSSSSIEELLAIAPAVGLPSPRLLAQLLDIEPTDTFLSIENLGEVILELLIATHPEVVRDAAGEPSLRVTLYDALQDLAPVAERFGPAEGHPGFLTGESRATVFEPGFLLSVPVRSNIDVREGVDASAQTKAFLFVFDEDSTISIDFVSDDATIVGVADEPTVDLEFVLSENSSFLSAGADQVGRPDADRPGFFRGAGQSFDAAPWQIERLIAESAYLQYATRFGPDYTNRLRYDAGSIVDACVIDWDRGWVAITTSGGLGNPPAPAYAWDILSEVAQLRLHEGGIAEGMVELAFRLPGLPIGLDADGLIERLRPSLQAQEAELADQIVNRESITDSTVDFFYEPRPDGALIYFVAPEDIRGGYEYERPGFFADAALTVMTSTLNPLGTDDTSHHKLVPVAGQAHFFEDDEGTIFRLDVVDVDDRGVTARVVPVGERS